MIVQSFLRWSETAKAADRAKAAYMLARVYAEGKLAADQRPAAEAAMTLLLEDPSPKVRISLADGIARAPHAPRGLILALAADQIEVAGRVVGLSPVLTDSDLVDLVASGRSALQQVIAHRHPLGVTVCAAIAEIGIDLAVIDMLDNASARVARISLKRIAERLGDHPEIRAQLFDRADLPCETRQSLVEKVGAALAGFGLVRCAIGSERIHRVTEEACQTATLRLTEAVAIDEMPALVEHLRISGRLTPAFLMHGLCAGNVDFFAAAIVCLSGMSDSRVRGILIDGREPAMKALYRASGIDAAIVSLFVSATLMWREASRKRGGTDTGAVTARLIERHAAEAAFNPPAGDLLRLVETMHHSWQRQASRDYAASLAAAAA